LTDDVRVVAAVDHLAVHVGTRRAAGRAVRLPRLVLRVRCLRPGKPAGHGVALLTGEGVLSALRARLASRARVALPGWRPRVAGEGAWTWEARRRVARLARPAGARAAGVRLAAWPPRVALRREAVLARPSGYLLSRPLTWIRPVAGRHARLAGELRSWRRAVAGGAWHPRLRSAGGVRERHAAGTRVRVVEPGRAVSGGRVAGRTVSGAAGGAVVGWKAAWHGKRGPRRERTPLGEATGPGEHPRGRRRLWRVAARPGEPAAGVNRPWCGTRARERTGLRVVSWRGPRALARERAVPGRRTAWSGERVRVAPVAFSPVRRADQASRCEDRGRRQHPVGIVVDLAARPRPRVPRLTVTGPGSAR
jgi:hypothetical protein